MCKVLIDKAVRMADQLSPRCGVGGQKIGKMPRNEMQKGRWGRRRLVVNERKATLGIKCAEIGSVPLVRSLSNGKCRLWGD